MGVWAIKKNGKLAHCKIDRSVDPLKQCHYWWDLDWADSDTFIHFENENEAKKFYFNRMNTTYQKARTFWQMARIVWID